MDSTMRLQNRRQQAVGGFYNLQSCRLEVSKKGITGAVDGDAYVVCGSEGRREEWMVRLEKRGD
jgi:hypothetical protein